MAGRGKLFRAKNQIGGKIETPIDSEERRTIHHVTTVRSIAAQTEVGSMDYDKILEEKRYIQSQYDQLQLNLMGLFDKVCL